MLAYFVELVRWGRIFPGSVAGVVGGLQHGRGDGRQLVPSTSTFIAPTSSTSSSPVPAAAVASEDWACAGGYEVKDICCYDDIPTIL